MNAQVLQGLQLLHVPVDQSFQPTSNARNEKMFKEATSFAQHIRTMEKDLRAMERQLAGRRQQHCEWQGMLTCRARRYGRLHIHAMLSRGLQTCLPQH